MNDTENETVLSETGEIEGSETSLMGGEENAVQEPGQESAPEGEQNDEGGSEEQEEHYSLEQLENWDDERDGEIDPELIPPAFKKIYEKLVSQKTASSSAAPKTFEEQLKEFSGEEDLSRSDGGLSVEDSMFISREAANQTKNYLAKMGEEYDEYNQEHREILSGIKNSLTEHVKQRKKEQAAYNSIDDKMRRKYGADYAKVDAEVARYLNEDITVSQLRRLNAAILSGNMDIAASLYDMASKKLNGGATRQVKAKPARRPVFPPHAVSGGNPPSTQPKQLTEKDFLWEDNKWHKM